MEITGEEIAKRIGSGCLWGRKGKNWGVGGPGMPDVSNEPYQTYSNYVYV